MDNKECSILFLGKKNDPYTAKALSFCQANNHQVSAYLSHWGEPMPQDIGCWEGDYIVSYLSRWVVPENLLKKAKLGAINFHPASPEYPGIGCNNFALYDEAKDYGVTCHHMAASVDTGAIIAVKRFQVFPSDDVETLLLRTYDHQIVLFYEVMSGLFSGKSLPHSDECWARKPFTRDEFNELSRITFDMSKDEISKRIRATAFGTWKPTIQLHGFAFDLNNAPHSSL